MNRIQISAVKVRYILFRFIWILLLLLLQGNDSISQSFSDKSVTIDPVFSEFRLPGENYGNAIQKIAQDSIGFLWFGSQNGLHRYDGLSVKTFRHQPENKNSILNNYIEDIYVDKSGNIWLAHYTSGGITCYDPYHEKFIRHQFDPDDPEGIVGNTTNVIAQDHEGLIWIGTDDGLSRMDPATGKCKNFKHIPGDGSSLSCNVIRDIYVDKKGVVWVATGFPFDINGNCGGLNRFDPKSQKFVRYLDKSLRENQQTNLKIRGMLEDSKGNFWVGTNGNDLYLLDRNTEVFRCVNRDMVNYPELVSAWKKIKFKTPSSHVTSITEDNTGKLWITLYNSGVMIFDPETKTCSFTGIRSKAEGKISSGNAWQIFEAKDGSMWMATAAAGMKLYKLTSTTNPFNFFSFKPYKIYLLNDDVISITDDTDGNIWIGTRSPEYPLLQILHLNRKQPLIQKIHWPAKIQAKYVTSLTVDKSSGDLWIGTDRGLLKRDRVTGKFDHYLDHLNYTTIQSPLIAKNGLVWVPDIETGLYRLNPETRTFTHFNLKNRSSTDSASVANLNPHCVHEDINGQIWVGGGGWNDIGNPLYIDRYDAAKGTFVPYIKEKEATAGVEILSSENYLWFCNNMTNIQQIDMRNGSRKIIFTLPVYPEDLIESRFLRFNRDDAGRFWMYKNGRIFRFDHSDNKYYVFGSNYGIPKIGKTGCNLFKTANNHMLIAGENGMISFDPSQVSNKQMYISPKVIISGMYINNREIKYNGNTEKILTQPIFKSDIIHFNHLQNTFSFSLACFDFFDPSNIILEYMIEGIDNTGWRRDLTGSQTITYNNIPPGKYTLKVKGTNSFGVESAEITSLQIVIHPPWWKTIWAYIFYIVTLIVIIWSYIRFKSKAIRKQNVMLEKQVKIRTSELNKTLEHLKHTQNHLIQKEKMASLGELTAGIAHEIQNPLNFVNNFSEVSNELIDEMSDELTNGDIEEAKAISADIKSNLEKINHHGKRAADIVKGMLEHSRNSSGEKVPTNINALADEYLKLAYQSQKAKDQSFNTTLETHFDPNLPKIEIIPQDIGRVLLNLINNAFYAVKERSKRLERADSTLGVGGKDGKKVESDYIPTVSITTQLTANSQILITIKDNGIGIPDHIKDKIFQPFFTTKPTGQGIGLGLSLSYDIVEAHGGELKVETKEGKGSEFMIVLPV